jgi:1-acyl-sn-glycerol-3-phosphate acyltransferase
MLDFPDKPYRYFPPKYSAVWAKFFKAYNRKVELPRKLLIEQVQVHGWSELARQIEPGDRLVFLPNHSTHADAPVLVEALRQCGLHSFVMAAYEGFLKNRVQRFALQRMGCFSVDRDASDTQPMKQAVETIEQGDHVLTIFPEGNVYLTNDRITPLLDGAAFITLRAQQSLLKKGRRVLAVPVSMKLTHLTNARELIARRLDPLIQQLELEVDLRRDPAEAIRGVGQAALHRNLKQRGLDVPEAESLAELVPAAAGRVLDGLEKKLDLQPKPGATLIDRVRQCRRVIHEVRTDPDRAVDHAAANIWANEAMLAFRIASYAVGYATQHPTIDRIGETVEKLEEDMRTALPAPVAKRYAFVRFNNPLDLRDYLHRFAKLRQATHEVTRDIEKSIQEGLDRINRENPYPGGQMW